MSPTEAFLIGQILGTGTAIGLQIWNDKKEQARRRVQVLDSACRVSNHSRLVALPIWLVESYFGIDNLKEELKKDELKP